MPLHSIQALLLGDADAASELQRSLAEAEAPSARITALPTIETALEALASEDFDAVIVDARRPRAGFTQAVGTLRALCPKQPVIVLADADDDGVETLPRQQSADVVLRPALMDVAGAGRVIAYEVERKRLCLENTRLCEEVARSNRARDEFVAMLSHELRTPLTAILGWAVLLRDGRMPAESTARALASIEQNARDQGRLIDDLLDLSHIITGKLTLNVAPMILVSVIEAAVDSVRLAADAKQVSIECRLDADVPPLLGDANRLQQVLWNLLSNSVKFTPRRGRIEVALCHLDGQTEIEVSDNGIGIAPAALPHVFERFRQADSSVSRSHGGLGLGLAIVRHLVEMHGGTVQAHSEGEGKGCRFVVRLPALAEAVQVDPPE